MKRFLLTATMILLAVPAFAGEMNSAASWTGCYVGANAGAAWNRDDWRGKGTIPPLTEHMDNAGFLGGGQVGCDYQNGSAVVGISGMFDWANFSEHAIDPINTSDQSNTRLKMFDAATARMGYAFDRSLIYVDAGAAWAREQRFFSAAGSSTPIGAAPTTTELGWVIGAGYEYLVTQNWSWKVEYQHADFGNKAVMPDGVNIHAKAAIDVLLVGINYRFAP